MYRNDNVTVNYKISLILKEKVGGMEENGMIPSKKSIEKLFLSAHLTIENALNDDELLLPLNKYGYNGEKLQEGRALYESAQKLHLRQRAAYGEQFTATDALKALWKQAKEAYMPLVKLARIALRDDAGAYTQLELNGRRKRILHAWLAQAGVFYGNALSVKEITDKLGQLGVTRPILIEGQNLVSEVKKADAAQKNSVGIARQATIERDNAINKLDRWIRDFKVVARIALQSGPQNLEKLGIVVKS